MLDSVQKKKDNTFYFAWLSENDVPPLQNQVCMEKTSLGQLRKDPQASPLGLSGAALKMSVKDPPIPYRLKRKIMVFHHCS